MAAKKKKEKPVTLETVLWNCRVALRGIGSLEKNRDAVIGLVFLKFAGEKFLQRREEIAVEYAEKPAGLIEILREEPASYAKKNVFYLPETCRWSYLRQHASDNDIAVKLDKAMQDIEHSNAALKGALQHNLYASLGAANSKLKSLIDEVDKISNYRMKEDDLIGRVYEYFLRIYAASGKKEDGEFYTPASAVKLIAALIEPYRGRVYDPCCGSGGMFVQSMKFVGAHHGNRTEVSILGQESNPATWQLARLNLASRGIACNLGEQPMSTFEKDQHPDAKVDYVMANPPFNLKDWQTATQTGEKKDPRFTGWPMPPASNANYAWILHILSKLDVTHGVAGFLLSNGALNATGVEAEIRKELIKQDRVEAIIVLPRDMFYTTDISVTLWIVSMNKGACERDGRQLRDRRGKVFFMDLRTWNKHIEETVIDKGQKKKKVMLTDEEIHEVQTYFHHWQSAVPYENDLVENIPELCRSVTSEEIAQHGYVLTPSTYLTFVDHDLDIDYAKEMAEIQGMMRDVVREEKESQAMLVDAFRGIGYGIA